jgi:signal transduction histidine kinase
MEGHNSRVEVQSTFGEGSVFSFRLPAGEDYATFAGVEEDVNP